MPPFRLSAGRVGVQPAAELRHLQRHGHEPHVPGALHACSAPNLQSSLHCTLDAVAPACWPAPSPRTVCPPFDSRQFASAFNQPLSFDTSSVTNMFNMFYVRSCPCHAPNLQSSPPLHAACTAVARRLPPPGPNLAPYRMPSVRLSAVRVGVQPAAELRHLQRHNHVPDVRGALLPLPCPKSADEPAPARCLHRGRPPPSRLQASTSPRTACPPFGSRQGASAFNQPLSFDTSGVTSMTSMFHVRSSPCPAPNLQSSPPPHAACTAVARRLPPPGPHLTPHRMPSVRLSAVRVCVQPAAGLRHL
eukprot:scaffold67892_cov48-Phaeocystis_antarctica.AAC.1